MTTDLVKVFLPYFVFSIVAAATLLAARAAIWLAKRMSRKLGQRFKTSPDMLRLIDGLVRLSIWTVAIALVILESLAVFGLGGYILSSLTSTLTVQSGLIGLIIIIVIIAYVSTKFVGIFFVEFRAHTRLDPFTVELVRNLVRYSIYAIAGILVITNILVAAGLGVVAGSLVTLFAVFVGIAVSFAATGSLGNALAGVVLMSWRPYREGERVEIGGGTYGDVQELDIMFTKIRTIKDEIVHVPNLQVLGNKIINYSGLSKVLVHQQVTIGYDVKRTRVEELLLKSAKATENLLHDPTPFVLIRSLDNYYVTYEINAYTDKPNKLIVIYSDLMKHILDIFEEAKIEILSPQYVVYISPHEPKHQFER
jgi:small-conductance mechanosensitive channel